MAAAGRLLGFVLLAGPALLIIAGVVLLPAYARLLDARHERDSLQAKNDNDEVLTVAYQRLIDAIPNDQVLAKRLAMREFGFLPRNERPIPAGAHASPYDAGLVQTTGRESPADPNGWASRTAGRLQSPVSRTFLLLFAIVTLLAAMMLSDPSPRRCRGAFKTT